MLDSLISCLENNGYSIKEPLSSFHNAPCGNECTQIAFNFNAIATQFYQHINEPQPPTVNALFFDKEGNLFFLEMNQYYVAEEDFKREFIDDKFGSLNEKIDGTIDTLTKMIHKFNCDEEILTALANPRASQIKTILLTEITDEQYVILRMSNLDKLNIASHDSTKGEIGIVTCEEFNRLFN